MVVPLGSCSRAAAPARVARPGMLLGKRYRVPKRTVTLCPHARVGNEDWVNDDDDDQEDDFLEGLDDLDGEGNTVATGETDNDAADALRRDDPVARALPGVSVAPSPAHTAMPGATGVGPAWVIVLGIAALVAVSTFVAKYARNAWTSRSKRSSDKVCLLGCALSMKLNPHRWDGDTSLGWRSCTRVRESAFRLCACTAATDKVTLCS
jgi:hypothetical protein